MGLISALAHSTSGVLADQWKEYFYCESMSEDTIMVKGSKKVSKRSSNTKGTDNIISNGSVIAVNEGQCMLIVEQGKVVDLCAEPGEYIYDTSTEPSIFYGGLGKGIKDIFAQIGKRFTFGGIPAKDQRVYYFNIKELVGNKYGTPNPVPFRVVDRNIGLDVDITIRCFGEYSYRISNPILFYTNVCGNVKELYSRSQIDGQLKTELLTALQPAFAKISDMGVRYSALPGHTQELADALNQVLTEKWSNLRGIEIVSIGVSSVKASEEDEKMIKDMQKSAVFRDPTMAAAHMVGAQADAMKAAASNTGGAAMAFMGMNMAAQAGGVDVQSLYNMSGSQKGGAKPAADGWTCSCGTVNKGKFCAECGKPMPAPKDSWTCSCGAVNTGKFCAECGSPKPVAGGWTCSCGTVNKGKFCAECGSPKPAGAPLYKCDKCGWEPSDPTNPPKFCPECGDLFDEADIQK